MASVLPRYLTHQKGLTNKSSILKSVASFLLSTPPNHAYPTPSSHPSPNLQHLLPHKSPPHVPTMDPTTHLTLEATWITVFGYRYLVFDTECAYISESKRLVTIIFPTKSHLPPSRFDSPVPVSFFPLPHCLLSRDYPRIDHSDHLGHL